MHLPSAVFVSLVPNYQILVFLKQYDDLIQGI